MSKITGKVWNFGANIDTDVIIAARYLNSSDPEHLAKYVMEDADPEFPKKLKKGDIIVAGENFGCGSSREHAPIALKAAGVAAVVAPSFARIFYRASHNSWNPNLAPAWEYVAIPDGSSSDAPVVSPGPSMCQ